MSARIIDPDRYKKTTRKKAAKAKFAQKNSLKYRKEKLKIIKERKKVKKQNNFNYDKFNNERINTFSINNSFDENYNSVDNIYANLNYKKKDKKKYKKNYQNKTRSIDKEKISIKTVVIAVSLVLCVGVIGVLSKIIVRKEKEVIVETDTTPVQKVTLVQDYDFKIGMANLDTIEYMKSKNIILNELVKISNLSLITVNKDYTINYKVAKNIEKINTKEYIITLSKEYDINAEDVIKSVEKIKSVGKENIYYNAISNIENITKQDEMTLKISLKNDNNYFLYELDFPLYENLEKSDYNITSENGSILLNNQNSNSTLKSIKITGYEDSDSLINEFRNSNIDMFTASSDSIIKLIGKHDYNVKKYRDGETIFLFGNKDSNLFSKKEIRQALVYSLNRDEIVKEINSTFAEIIDIPYIYSNIKMKYDVYGAQNVLLAQGWQKKDGIYRKKIGDKLVSIELNLLVNENDKTKVKIAEKIKEMAQVNGIKININKQKDEALKEHIANKKYDIILADVFINNIPNIDFIKDYLNINDEINKAIDLVNKSSVEDLPKNIDNLQTVLSSEVACIGILARNISVVYQKNINGFYDIGYMKLFENIEKIGKIQNIKSDVESN